MSANPYWMFSWQDLGRVAEDLVTRLDAMVPTPERADLDTRLSNLLWEVLRRMRPNFNGGSGADALIGRIGPSHLVQACMAEAETTQRNERLRILNHAAGLVLGGEARWWMERAEAYGAPSPHTAAMSGDEGLRRALEALQRLAIDKGMVELKRDKGQYEP